MLLFQKFGSNASSEPGSNSALNIEGSFCSLFVPHGGREVLAGVDDLVSASVDVQTGLLHLHSELPHHGGALRFIFISLHLAFQFLSVVVGFLISLGEGMVEYSPHAVVPETAEVRLGSLLLFNGNCNNFDLVVSQTDFYFKPRRHHELVSIDGVVIVGVLLLNLLHVTLHLLLGIHAFHVLHLLLVGVHATHVFLVHLAFHLTVHFLGKLITSRVVLQRLLDFLLSFLHTKSL